MSTGDDETVILYVGAGSTPGQGDHEPDRPGTRPERAVALPAAVAVAALLIVVTVVGSSLAHKHQEAAPTWVTTPSAQAPASPSPGVSVTSQSVGSTTVKRESVAASREPTHTPSPATTKASPKPTVKASPSKSPTPTASPTPSCTLPPWPPHSGCKHHHH